MVPPASAPLDFARVFEVATTFTPYPWQEALAARATPADVIVAETGTGKTEAVTLDWLWRRRLSGDGSQRACTPRRLVLTLPMRALVDQTIARVRCLLERLERAGLTDPADPVTVYQLMGGAADDDWGLYPAADEILVGTIDMLLSRALNRGYGRGRAAWPLDFGLINTDTHFVLDEVQLLDVAVATSAQLAAFRREASLGATPLPARTTWMSATINPTWLETLDHPSPTGFAGITDNDEAGRLNQRLSAPKRLMRVEADPREATEIARLVGEVHERARPRPGEGPWLTVAMCNTVARAQALHDALEMSEAGGEQILLHSRFRPPDREHRVAALADAPRSGGRIVVTTQVIEAGMDLDAAALVTELAPWASIVQRAGRLNRSGERRGADLVWIDPPNRDLAPEIASPYAPEELAGARGVLCDLDGDSFSPARLRARRLSDPAQEARLVGSRPEGLLLRRPDG